MLLQNYFETRIEMIEAGILEVLDYDKRYAVSLKEAIHKALIPGGKRWRPLLLISMFEMLTGHKKNHKLMPDVLNAAVAVELIHNAMMVHDDMPQMMNQTERRALPAIHQEYGNAIAILAADAIYTLAFEEIGKIRDAAKAVEATRILAIHSKSYGVLGGQAVALASLKRVMKINTLRFIDMKKVGALLQACAEIACVLAESDEETRQAMNTYAMNLGMCYQMIDDIEADYGRGSEGLDFDEEYVPASKSGYTGLMGFDKARKEVEKLLAECERIIEPYNKNDALVEFINMIKERLP